METRRKAPKGKGKALQDMEGFSGNVTPRRIPYCLPDFREQQREEYIRDVGEDQFLDLAFNPSLS